MATKRMSDRRRFERWHARTFGWADLSRHYEGDYKHGTVSCRFDAWMAGIRAGRRLPENGGGK